MMQRPRVRGICFVFLVTLLILPAIASSEEEVTYEFERMWPTLQQPWYFFSSNGIATDSSGSLYVVNTTKHSIQKFTSDGQLLTQWGGIGSTPGKFFYPNAVAVEGAGRVYVADTYNDRIQGFSSDGRFLVQWGEMGEESGQFSLPTGVAVDNVGDVYVADYLNNRIQKFDPDGQFLLQWGSSGWDPGEFDGPLAVAVDAAGLVYVADTRNDRVQKFTSDGQFLLEWGDIGDGPGEFLGINGIAVDESGMVYVSEAWEDEHSRIQKFTPDGAYLLEWGDFGREAGQFGELLAVAAGGGVVYGADLNRIQKFTLDGTFLEQWASFGSLSGQFDVPGGIAIDDAGDLYIVDRVNNRIQKFASDGRFLGQWGSEGSGPGQLELPDSIVMHGETVYIADVDNYRIQRLTTDGQFVTEWGSQGNGDGQFEGIAGIAIDADGNVYVADYLNDCVQKFTEDGQFLTKWGSLGDGPGEFWGAYGVAVDSTGAVYVADIHNDRVQKFDSDGQFLTQWGSYGGAPGEFFGPSGIAVDSADNVYVGEMGNNRIQKFTSDGESLSIWGSEGTGPGNFDSPTYLAVDSAGAVYVSDTGNNRIQKFAPVTVSGNSKAIVVAGGGPFPGNNLWAATQMCANFAYRTLTYQGFTKDSIYYLSSNLELDLDGNGEPDEVDGDATNANLEYAITAWAADAESVVVYLTDHGGGDTFRMSGTETLSSSDLDSWLDTLQETMVGRVVVVYDACDSGSFASSLTPHAGKERIVITSTSPGESAYFVSQGTISFSDFFWTHIFNGLDIAAAFTFASESITRAIGTQHPQVDANGNGQAGEAEDLTLIEGVFIGNGTDLHEDRPVIGGVSAPQTIEDTNSATLAAFNVTDTDGIMRVWAVIWPPEYEQGSSDSPVLRLPSVDLSHVGDDNYEVTYDGFSIAGTYQVAIYAKDRIGNTSLPSLTEVSVTSPLSRKAVIVAGGAQSDPLWPAIENCAGLAYEALTFQGYTDDDIYFMSPVSVAGVDGLATLSNIEYALTTWALENTQDVILYMVGDGDVGSFNVSETETLSAGDLDTWLDELQEGIPGTVTVIYDACRSASFLSALTPPTGKERITISGASEDEPAHFLSEGNISFSRYFWRALLDGSNIRDAFLHAKVAIEFTGRGQTAQLDDNGNGVGNEKTDGRLARNHTIGVGIILAADDPLIGSICPAQTLCGDNTPATIWVEDVTTTGVINAVWAVITPPDFSTPDPSVPVTDLQTVNLAHVGGGRYEGTYSGFSAFGTYDVAVYAMDEDGNVSLPLTTTVTQAGEADVNFDGAVNALDVQLVINAALGLSVIYDCDLNEDGQVNALDVQLVINAALGIQS